MASINWRIFVTAKETKMSSRRMSMMIIMMLGMMVIMIRMTPLSGITEMYKTNIGNKAGRLF